MAVYEKLDGLDRTTNRQACTLYQKAQAFIDANQDLINVCKSVAKDIPAKEAMRLRLAVKRLEESLS